MSGASHMASGMSFVLGFVLVTSLRRGAVTCWVLHPDPADSQIAQRLVRIVTTLR